MGRYAVALLMLFACQSEGTDGKSTDGTDIDTDVASTEIPEFNTIEPIREPVEFEWEGLEVVAYAPADPTALVMFFHGTGGNAGVATSTEAVAILNEMVRSGFGYVSTTSVNRATGQFDTTSDPDDNPDIAMLSSLLDNYISEGVIDEDIPIFTIGFSAGGSMANYVAHASEELGWSVQAAAFLGSGGGGRRYSGTAPVPVAFLPSEHDVKVPPDVVIDRQEDHAAAGHVSELMMCAEVPLHPTRFARTRFINQNQSRQIFEEAVDNGFFSADGERLFAAEDIEASVDDFTFNYEVINRKPVTAVLNVVLATHAINGMHAEAMAAFFEDHL